MPKWEKKGDFSLDESGIYIKRRIKYQDPKTGHRLSIYGFRDNEFSAEYDGASDDLFEAGRREIAGFASTNARTPGINNGCVHMTRHADRDGVNRFLELIDRFDSLSEVKREIRILVGIKRPESEVKEECFALVDQKKYADAIAMTVTAEADGYHNVIFELAEFFNTQDSPISLDRLFNLYQEISKENPHYREARTRLLDIVPRLEPTSSEEMMALRGITLQLAIEADVQLLADQSFHLLSGGTGLTPTISNVGCNITTLVGTASEIARLRQALMEEKGKVARLEAGRRAQDRFLFKGAGTKLGTSSDSAEGQELDQPPGQPARNEINYISWESATFLRGAPRNVVLSKKE